MTEAEATDYVRNSMFKDITFYHGTSGAGASSITTSGIDIQQNRVAVYGQGFYLADDRISAKGYAITKTKPTLLTAKLDMRNPLVVDNYKEVAAAAGTNFSEDQRINLKAKGYDGVYVKKIGYYVAFDPEQVAVYKKEKV